MFDFFGVINSSLYDAWLHHHGHRRSGKFADISNSVDAGIISMQDFFDSLETMSGIPSNDIKAEFKTLSTINKPLVELIKSLKEKYKIVLLSNASGSYLRNLLRQHNLEPLFDVVVISGEIGLIKPGREIFEYALKEAGASHQSAIFIDDHKFNVDAAENYGIKSVLYRDVEQLKSDFRRLGVI